MRKYLSIVLAAILAALPLGCAMAEEAALLVLSVQSSDAVAVSFEVTEAVYDGHTVQVTLVQTADDPQVLLYDDSVSGMTEAELLPPPAQRRDKRFLGVYSEWALLAPDGSWMVPDEGESFAYANPLPETWHWYLDPDEPLPRVTLRLCFGLVETPGEVESAQLQCCTFRVDLQDPFGK